MGDPRLFTSESVNKGHPDKIADQISDAVLDALLKDDPNSRVACETMVTTGMAVLAGEITTSTYVHIPDIVREFPCTAPAAWQPLECRAVCNPRRCGLFRPGRCRSFTPISVAPTHQHRCCCSAARRAPPSGSRS